MSYFLSDRTRTASPGVKQVAFDHKCQVIPETDCAELRKLLSLCPTRAQSPPIVGSSSGFIARAISPQLARAKSPVLKKATGLGNAPSGSSSTTSWRTRLASWGSTTSNGDTSINTIDANVSAAFSPPVQSQPMSSNDGPRLVAPIPARGALSPMVPFDDDVSVDVSPSNESVPDFDDVTAEFQHAISGAAILQRRSSVGLVHGPSPSPSILSVIEPPRSSSPFVRSASEMRNQRPVSSNSRPKSCLVRYSTPQAPGPPGLSGDGMSALRITRSFDRDGCFAPRRRADGVPVICPSPLSSPEDEQGTTIWSPTDAAASQPAKQSKQTGAVEKTKLSRWKRFRRAMSEDAERFEPRSSCTSSSGTILAPEMRLDDAAVKRQIQAGRWPFEAPLNAECSCKNCQDKIEVGLAADYEPKWTRAARIRWLEAQEDAAFPPKDHSENSSAGPKLRRAGSRTAIQADEVAQLHNETVHPMTEAELAESEPISPSVERSKSPAATTAEAVGLATKPSNGTGVEDGDEALRREIMARRQQAARKSPVMRHGARSMMRQIEEAERREQEAARARTPSRESHCSSPSRPRLSAGSGRSSPASPASPAVTPSTSATVSTQPREPPYFEFARGPPERVRSPLIPANVACNPQSGSSPALPRETDKATLSMASVAQTLEAIASPTVSSNSSPGTEKQDTVAGGRSEN